MREMEIIALAGANETNADPLNGLVASYRNMMFPGTQSQTSPQKDEMERRKAALAAEAQKAFIVRPVDIKSAMKKAINNPEYGKLAGRAFAEHERERMKELHKKARVEHDRAQVRRQLKKKMKER